MASPIDDPVKFYLNEVAKVPPLSVDEENALFEKLRRHPDEAAERRLIEGRLALVVQIAERYASSGMPMLELLQEGNCGLMKAVRQFAKKPSGEFSTYASTLIDEAIREAVAGWNQSNGG